MSQLACSYFHQNHKPQKISPGIYLVSSRHSGHTRQERKKGKSDFFLVPDFALLSRVRSIQFSFSPPSFCRGPRACMDYNRPNSSSLETIIIIITSCNTVFFVVFAAVIICIRIQSIHTSILFLLSIHRRTSSSPVIYKYIPDRSSEEEEEEEEEAWAPPTKVSDGMVEGDFSLMHAREGSVRAGVQVT